MSTDQTPKCPNCESMQRYANKIGDESHRVSAARQELAVALIFICRDLRAAEAAGETHVEIPRVLKALDGTQQRTRHTMNAPLTSSRRTGEPFLPMGQETDRSPETIALILRIVTNKCEELARNEPDGSHSKRALSDLSLLADGWITPQSLGFVLPTP